MAWAGPRIRAWAVGALRPTIFCSPTFQPRVLRRTHRRTWERAFEPSREATPGRG